LIKGIDMNRFFLTTLAASAVGLVALGPAANAEKVTQSRDLAPFQEIKALGSSDVIVEIGKKQSVRVEAEDDEIDEILTEIKGDTLVIRPSRQ
jgi:hypothetical protein